MVYKEQNEASNLSELRKEDSQKMSENKSRWDTLAELFHYSSKTGLYKRLELARTDRGIVIALREGQKGKERNSIVFQLNEQEIALLALKLMKLV